MLSKPDSDRSLCSIFEGDIGFGSASRGGGTYRTDASPGGRAPEQIQYYKKSQTDMNTYFGEKQHPKRSMITL